MGIVHPKCKFCHHSLTLSFQTSMHFFFFSVKDKIIHKRSDALDPTDFNCMDRTVGNLTLCSTEEGVSYKIMGKKWHFIFRWTIPLSSWNLLTCLLYKIQWKQVHDSSTFPKWYLIHSTNLNDTWRSKDSITAACDEHILCLALKKVVFI